MCDGFMLSRRLLSFKEKPYRQRVYRLSISSGLIESQIYELPNPEAYIHAWENMELFTQLKPENLKLRAGCSVYLRKKGDCFEGATKNKECSSTLRGASYATSIVKICADQVISWDQGWDQNDQQVWGAEKGGYIFNRMDK